MRKENYLLDSTYGIRNYDPLVGGIDTKFYRAFIICFSLIYR